MEVLKLSIIFIIFVTLNFSVVNSEFVTLWTPKFVQEDAVYRIFILPSNISKNTEVAVQFRKTSASYTLTNNKLGAIEYGSKQRNFGNITSYDLTMTLLRNVTANQMQCSTKSISVDTSTGNFYNFIQTDKPIYKPGDEVQFRILTVDKDLIPFHRNSINVTITDPAGRAIYNFVNQAGKYIGVFDDKFTLSQSTMLGDWMITVIVDKKEHMATSKIFAVQKYNLPLFDAYIDLPETHIIHEWYFSFAVFAKYSFGEYVKGTAEVVIRNPKDNKVFFNERYTDVQKPRLINTDALKDLYFSNEKQIPIEISLLFTEATSGIKYNKTATLYAHYSTEDRFEVFHDEKWLPGFPFTTKIYIYNWKLERKTVDPDNVNLEFGYRGGPEHYPGAFSAEGVIRDGIYVYEFSVPLDYTELDIGIRIGRQSFTYYKRLERGFANVGLNSLLVSHLPENPGIGETVKVYVTSPSPLSNIIISILTRYGNVKTRQIDCSGESVCGIDVVVDAEMMPHSTITAYEVRDKKSIFQGQTKIVTEDLGRNYLKVDLPTTQAKTKQNLKMKFSTKENSKIYFLAFDKRLISLRDGNDFTREDVVKSVADYDGINKVLVDDMSSWHVCSQEEVDRVINGRVTTETEGGTEVHFPDEPLDDMTVYEGRSSNVLPPKSDDGLLREYFPETWIFETLEVGSKSLFEKTYTVPDSMTTWLLSAFSVHNDNGLAISPRQELVVKNQFFVEMSLPYSIRYTEVLKLDIMVFNYIDIKEEVTVDLKLNNLNDGHEFQFVEYSSSCTPSYHDATSASAKVKVPYNEASTVNFYIRSHPSSNKFDGKKPKTMTIDVEASTTSSSWTKYSDRVRKQLIVDPVGVKVYKVESDFFKLDGGTTNSHIQQANFSQDLSNIDVVVTGDYLTDTMKLEEQLELYATDCLEQRSTKFKRNVDTFHYLEVKGKNPSKKHFQEQYQAVLESLKGGSYHKSSAWFRAYLSNILATAMTVDAIPVDKRVVFESMDVLQDLQESDGTFTSSKFNYYYGLPGNKQDSSYTYSEKYFAAAYCLIPVVRHRSFMEGRYDNFIKKGFSYLDNDKNRLQVWRHGLSVAAYVYALDGQKDKAKNLLVDVEQAYIQRENNKKCYKIFEEDTDCDVRHTTFVALTYLALKDLVKAEPIIYYLLSKKQAYDLSQNTQYLAVVTEPIAEMGVQINVGNTNLKITVKDEHSFKQDIQITGNNSDIPLTIEMPQGSEEVNSLISGQGYCTISAIFERIVTVPQINNVFSLTIKTGQISGSTVTKYVEICATYNQQTGMKPILNNVVYEVEMPSGYVYLEIKDPNMHNDLPKEISTKRQNTLVNLFYDNFEKDKTYCIELKVTQKFAVNEAVNAGVKVYNFDDKQQIVVGFYKFNSDGC